MHSTPAGNYSLNGLVGFEMFKKTVGVIGTGAIGYEACRILQVRRPHLTLSPCKALLIAALQLPDNLPDKATAGSKAAARGVPYHHRGGGGGAAPALCPQGIGCRVIAHDLYPSDKVKALGVPYLPLDELLPQCDIITLHTPLLPSTKHIINRCGSPRPARPLVFTRGPLGRRRRRTARRAAQQLASQCLPARRRCTRDRALAGGRRVHGRPHCWRACVWDLALGSRCAGAACGRCGAGSGFTSASTA